MSNDGVKFDNPAMQAYWDSLNLTHWLHFPALGYKCICPDCKPDMAQGATDRA